MATETYLGHQITANSLKPDLAKIGCARCQRSISPLTNGQTEQANQDLGSALRCVAAKHPVSWSTHLPWIEYARNSLVCSATGMSPFHVSMGFQPPLFPVQETEVAVPSVQEHLRRIRRVWREAREALTRTAARNRQLADHHCTPAPDYQVGSGSPLGTCPFGLSVTS